MTDRSWNVLGYCPTCGAQPGRPCRDLRRRRRNRVRGVLQPLLPPPKHAHRGRKQLDVPL